MPILMIKKFLVELSSKKIEKLKLGGVCGTWENIKEKGKVKKGAVCGNYIYESFILFTVIMIWMCYN